MWVGTVTQVCRASHLYLLKGKYENMECVKLIFFGGGGGGGRGSWLVNK